jgi:hypothetical protein
MANEELRRALKTDLYDDAPWTEIDLGDLRAEIERGRSIEKVAEFLCRSGSAREVRRKAAELGLSVTE